MCTGRCPVCGSYSCRCSDYRLREYQRDHQFDSPLGHPLRVWAQDDRNERVACELRDRRQREYEEEEERRRQERAANQRAEEEHQRQLNEAYEREMEEQEQRAREEEEQAQQEGAPTE